MDCDAFFLKVLGEEKKGKKLTKNTDMICIISKSNFINISRNKQI